MQQLPAIERSAGELDQLDKHELMDIINACLDFPHKDALVSAAKCVAHWSENLDVRLDLANDQPEALPALREEVRLVRYFSYQLMLTISRTWLDEQGWWADIGRIWRADQHFDDMHFASSGLRFLTIWDHPQYVQDSWTATPSTSD